jgi:tetratricopeptide (TPR) repeat protein
MSADDNEALLNAVSVERERLYAILDRDPEAAIAEARRLRPTARLDALNVELVRAALLVDAGSELKAKDIIEDGVAVLRHAYAAMPGRPDLAYNLGNGLSGLAQTIHHEQQPWFLATSEIRREARTLFEAASHTEVLQLESQAYTNQANLLAQAFRWVEAYDAYSAALRADPGNGVASSGMARMLLGRIASGAGEPDWLRSLAGKYIRLAQNSGARTQEYGGERALRLIRSLDPGDDSDRKPPDLSNASSYARFVARNGLAISLTLEGLDPDAKSWDTLVIASLQEPIDTDHNVPPIFAMWNVLKADFIAARWVAFCAEEGQVPETGSYSDTLDYANYGISQSLWTLAQRSAIDILDRVAVAASEYLHLSGSSRSIYFWNRWHKTDRGRLKSPREWLPAIQDEIMQGNTALIALSELAEDIAEDGFLNPKKGLRHSSTHRFVVLHDMGSAYARPSEHVEHYDQVGFESQTIASLRVARSALLYFLEMVAIGEAIRNRGGGAAVSLFVPPHHWIREP